MSTHLLGAAADNIVDCPVVTGQHARAKALDVVRSVTAEYIRQLDHDASKVIHQLIEGFDSHDLCVFGQMRVDTGSSRTTMAQPDLN